MSTIFSVSELTANIKGNLEKHFPFVWVKGEVSNLARPSSGHLYFALKDQDALLNCVWFKHAQRKEETFDPLTGEVFEDGPRPSMAEKLVNGQEVLCAGNISVYAPRGGYQLIISLVQEGGRGALYAAFEALKIRLEAQGYFSQGRKRPLPIHPRRVAVITAPSGAAIQDFLRIADTRGLAANIDIYPVPVQGDAAAPAIVQAFEMINQKVQLDPNNAPEIIVLIRGGGSLEDLWAFNEEIVAKSIFMSPLPVLAGIGHEVDISIADLTADVRAATPTHAAQILWQSREDYMQNVDSLEMALGNAMHRHLEKLSEKLIHKEQALKWLSPLHALQRKQERLQELSQKLQWHTEKAFENKRRNIDVLQQKLPNMHNNFDMLQHNIATLELRLAHSTERGLAHKEQALMRCADTLSPNMQRHINESEMLLQRLEAELRGANPLSPLTRGYALVQDASGKALRSVTQLHSGQDIHLQMADGTADALVKKVQ